MKNDPPVWTRPRILLAIASALLFGAVVILLIWIGKTSVTP